MRSILLTIEGYWGHFRRVETNNNPLTHDFITKTALIGLVGAVLGIDRATMRPLFPVFSEDFLYGVVIKKEVEKESWEFIYQNAFGGILSTTKIYRLEMLKNPSFDVLLTLKDERSLAYFDAFEKSIQNSQAKFTPVLGLHNCPARLSYLSSGEVHQKSGKFSTFGFITEENRIDAISIGEEFRIGFDKIPTYQNDDFWNLPDKYKEVIYNSSAEAFETSGIYFEFDHEKYQQWVLI